MADFLDKLAEDTAKTIREGYYEFTSTCIPSAGSLKDAIMRCRNAPVISEIKFTSPSKGTIRKPSDIKPIAKAMKDGGAVGISVLTEPRHFDGRLEFVSEVRSCVDTPVLMKDIVLSCVQIDAASKMGASAVLLIQALFDRGFCQGNIEDMVSYAHSLGLEVLLEAHTGDEFRSVIMSSADLVGINNRNLKTLEVDLDVTERILKDHHLVGKPIVSESGMNSPGEVRFLRGCGARAFLVGTAVMESDDIQQKVEELVNAL